MIAVYAQIVSVSFNEGLNTYGQEVVISGVGFAIDSLVSINNHDCKVISSSTIEIKCITDFTKESNLVTQTYYGTYGLILKSFDIIKQSNVLIEDLLNLPGFPSSNYATIEHIIEPSLSNTVVKSKSRGYLIESHFKALYSGTYRFFVSGQGPSFVTMEIDNVTKILSYKTSIDNLEDYLNGEYLQYDEVYLIEGNYYPIEVRAVYDQDKFDYLKIGFIIKLDNQDSSNINKNNFYQLKKISIKPISNTLRDLFKINISSSLKDTVNI